MTGNTQLAALRHPYVLGGVLLLFLLVSSLTLLASLRPVGLAQAASLIGPPCLASGSCPSLAAIQGMPCRDIPLPTMCEGRDPRTQGCMQDAISIHTLPVAHAGTPLGYVDLRFSKACNSYWVRTIAYASAAPLLRGVYAGMRFQAPIQAELETGLPQADDSLQAYTDMMFGQRPSEADAYGEWVTIDGTTIVQHV